MENKEQQYIYAYLGENGLVSFYNKRLEGISGTGYLGKIKLYEGNTPLLADE
jgi:hypothetical protein